MSTQKNKIEKKKVIWQPYYWPFSAKTRPILAVLKVIDLHQLSTHDQSALPWLAIHVLILGKWLFTNLKKSLYYILSNCIPYAMAKQLGRELITDGDIKLLKRPILGVFWR